MRALSSRLDLKWLIGRGLVIVLEILAIAFTFRQPNLPDDLILRRENFIEGVALNVLHEQHFRRNDAFEISP